MSRESSGPERADNAALLRAAREGRAELVRELLACGAEIEHAGADGATALIEAARLGHALVVRALLARGAQVDHRQNDGGTALLMAALNGCAEAVRDLLDHGADIDDTDNLGRSPLTSAASCRRAAAVRELLDRGAIVSNTDHTIFEEWLSWLETRAGEAYDEMYEARDSTAAAGSYANAKDFLQDALALARRLKQHDRMARLQARLDHIKAVFRSQFSS